MTEDNGNSAAAVSAAHIPADPLWKAPHTVADTQHPIKLETAEFDSSFIPYEIEYGVVMDQLSRIYKSWKSTIREYIANAESACMSALELESNYEPEINITYNPEQCLLTIEDNGIGLSKKMFMDVFRYFGRSRNAFDPTISGMFGLGTKSFVMLVGDKGSMVIHTKSRETGECYKMYARKVGFDVLPHEDRDYGTSFTFIHDPNFNRLDVVKTVGEYSRYVRVPVNFTITGSPVTVHNPGYSESRYYNDNVPREIIIKPSGPTTISMLSPWVVLEKKIKEDIKSVHDDREHSREYIKVHYDTEHYEFWGLIALDHTKESFVGRSNQGSASLLLISMPTDEVLIDIFSKAFIRIKSETGPEWLPKPTPDRERFEDTTKQAFVDRLRKDLMERRPTLAGTSVYYRRLDSAHETKDFNGIGEIESYKDYFSLDTVQRLIWKGIYECHKLKEGLAPAALSILDALYHSVEEWDTTGTGRWHRHSRGRGTREMHEVIEIALRNNKYVYIAPINAKRSSSMRSRCITARGSYNVVLLSPSLSAIPQALKQEIPVFRDLTEIAVTRNEKVREQVAFHEVEVFSGRDASYFDQTTRRSSAQKSLASIAEFERNRAVAFENEDNISEHISLLEKPAHTCPVGLFKATKTQIRWLAGNSRILSLKEYVNWAKKQELNTSKGRLTIGYLASHYSTVFHSVGKAAGSRLLSAFRNRDDLVYVPVTGEDYFMVASSLHQYKVDPASENLDDIGKAHLSNREQKKIEDSSGLAKYLQIDIDGRHHWSDNVSDRKALLIYSRLTLPDSSDQHAIQSIIGDTPLSDLTRIIDTIVKLRETTTRHKSREAKPEALGQFFRMAV
jgi:hypothetical protein